MEPLECYTFKTELQDSPIEECQIKTEPFQDDLIEGYPIKSEPFQDDLIEGYPIKSEPFQDDLTGECPIQSEKLQDKRIEECPIKIEIEDKVFVPETPQEEDTLSEDPLEPTLYKKRLDSQAKLMILNVHKYFRKYRLIRAKETGEDMNVNQVVAEATGVSESAVRKLFSEYLHKGTEMAIGPPKNRRRKTDIVVDAEEDSATITVKNKRKK